MTGKDPGRPGSRWRGALPELLVAAATVAAAAVAGYALAGPEAVTIVMIVAAAAALVVARALVPAAPPPVNLTGGTDQLAAGASLYGYWHYFADLRDGMQTRPGYERRLRPALEHLLAARLAERHGLNLYRDPAAARRLLCRPGRDDDLWAWIDPGRPGQGTADGPAPAGGQPPGIPRRTLERLIDRLEQL